MYSANAIGPFPADTQKVPGPVNVCTLKFVQTVVSVPPVAATNFCTFVTSLLLTACQPFVASPYTNVTAFHSVSKTKSKVWPSILSDPFAAIVKAFVSKFCA